MAASGLMSVHEAAERNNVPSTTLYDRVSRRVVHNVNPGPVRYLNPVEENTLATFLKHCSEVGYGKTRKEVLAIAEYIKRHQNQPGMVEEFHRKAGRFIFEERR